MSQSLKRSLLFSFLDRYASLAINILSSLVIARLLRPAEIGTFSVAMVFTSLLSTMRDMGIGSYLIQEKELTEARLRSAWGLQLVLGFACALVIALLAYPLQAFFAEPLLRPLLWIVACNFVVLPFGALNHALLIRDQRFDAVAVIRLSQTAMVALVSIATAYEGQGALSLAYGNLAGVMVAAVIGIALRRDVPWRPAFSEARRVLKAGTRLTGASLFSAASASAPEFVLGRLQSMATLGFYSRANGLVAMVNRLLTDAIYPVAEARLAQLHRNGEACAPAFIQMMACLTALGWPLCAFIAVTAEPLVLLMYGSQWAESVLPTRILAVSALLVLGTTLCYASLVATGKNLAILRGTALGAALTVVASLIGGAYSVIAMCAGLTVVAFIMQIIWTIVCRAALGLDGRAYLRMFLASAAVTLPVALAAAAALFLAQRAMLPLFLQLCCCGLAALPAWLAMIKALNHPLHPIVWQMASRLRIIRSWLDRRSAHGR